jgi:hypothetical protein
MRGFGGVKIVENAERSGRGERLARGSNGGGGEGGDVPGRYPSLTISPTRCVQTERESALVTGS